MSVEEDLATENYELRQIVKNIRKIIFQIFHQKYVRGNISDDLLKIMLNMLKQNQNPFTKALVERIAFHDSNFTEHDIWKLVIE